MKWILRILGAIIGVVVLAAALLGAMALRPDAGRLQSSITIHRPTGEVWPWLYEPDKLKAWVSWLKEIRPNTVEQPIKGQKAVWVMSDENNNGALMEIHDTVEAVEPNRLLSVSLTAAEGFTGKASYKLTPSPDGGTILESDSDFKMESAMFKFMTPLVIWQARKKLNGDMERLRALVEATSSR